MVDHPSPAPRWLTAYPLMALLLTAQCLSARWVTASAAGIEPALSRADWFVDAPRLVQQYSQQPVNPASNPWVFRPSGESNERNVPQAQMQGPALPPPGDAPSPTYPPGRWPPSAQGFRPPGADAPGRYPASRPGYVSGYNPFGRAAAASAAPSLEVSLLDSQPYVQEPVLLRLDVLSFGNLATASPELSGLEGVLLKELAGPRTSVRGSGRDRQIVNRYLLALTPLRNGPLEVGPLKVSGTLAAGVPFNATATRTTRLDVRPLVPSVRPWLPLKALQLTRDLDDSAGLEEGRPVTLTLRLEATGGLGEQLPDLEPQLASSAFRSYREQTIIESQLSDDGRELRGIRTEVYTLVPFAGGRLQLPEVSVSWWNVETARPERSSVPITRVSVAGDAGRFPFGLAGGNRDAEESGWSWVWMPLAGLLLLLIGYWAGVVYRTKVPSDGRPRGRGDRQIIKNWVGTRVSQSRRALGLGLRRLSPRPAAHWLARRLALSVQKWTPAPLRIYRCAIEAEQAESPSEWAGRFQRAACQSLRAPGQAPLPRIADRISQYCPDADAARLRSLLNELDFALYNGGRLDIERWKHDLRRALRPGWGTIRAMIRPRVRRARLPALNPSTDGPATT